MVLTFTISKWHNQSKPWGRSRTFLRLSQKSWTLIVGEYLLRHAISVLASSFECTAIFNNVIWFLSGLFLLKNCTNQRRLNSWIHLVVHVQSAIFVWHLILNCAVCNICSIWRDRSTIISVFINILNFSIQNTKSEN